MLVDPSKQFGTHRTPIILVHAFVNLLGVIGALRLRHHTRVIDGRIQLLLSTCDSGEQLEIPQHPTQQTFVAVKSPVPRFAGTALVLMSLSLLGILGFWITMLRQ
jgi:hypothetical protein